MKMAVFALLLCIGTFTHGMDKKTEDQEKKKVAEKEIQLCVQYSENNKTVATIIKVPESVSYDTLEKTVAEKTKRRSGSFSLMVPKATPETLSPKNFSVSKLEQPKSELHQDIRTFMRIVLTNPTQGTEDKNNQK